MGKERDGVSISTPIKMYMMDNGSMASKTALEFISKVINQSMKEITQVIKGMGMVHSLMSMVTHMKACGKTALSTVLVSTLKLKETSTQETTSMVFEKVKDVSFTKMETNIMDNGRVV